MKDNEEFGINQLLSEKNIIEVIIVNKNKFTEFFKGKGYYVLLFVGVIAIGAIAVLGSQLSSKQQNEKENIVDLNDNNIAAGEDDTEFAENNPVSEGIVNNASSSSDDTAAKDTAAQASAAKNDLIEYEGYAEDATGGTGTKQATDTAQAEEPEAIETSGTTVQADTAPVMDNLSFHAEDGLFWPVNGNVIMDYSMDHTIYFATLMQYKCNPAIIIDAEVGTEVKAAANGIVSDIDTENEETGITVTMNIGDGYSVVYGQLDNVTLEEGACVNEGEIIGTIGEPTKYYSLEGSNLYFMVKYDDNTINPMLLLR